MSRPKIDSLYLTNHVAQRIRQRGLRERDLGLVLECGTTTDEAVFLSKKDVAREVTACRHRIAQLERLRGTVVFVRESAAVTVFRPDRRQIRRILKRGAKMHRARPIRRRYDARS